MPGVSSTCADRVTNGTFLSLQAVRVRTALACAGSGQTNGEITGRQTSKHV